MQNMEPINWLFAALFIITFGLFITSYFIKKELITKITSIFLLPLFTINPLLFHFRYTPDSYHCIQYSIIAIFFFWIFQIMMILNKHKITMIAAKIFYLAGVFVWINFYKTIFYIYTPPAWLTIFSLIIFLGIIVTTLFLISSKGTNFSIKKNFVLIITIAAIEFLVYASFVALIYNHKINNLILFIGMILLLFSIIFYLIESVYKNVRFAKEIRQTAIILSQFAICLSNLMVFIL